MSTSPTASFNPSYRSLAGEKLQQQIPIYPSPISMTPDVTTAIHNTINDNKQQQQTVQPSASQIAYPTSGSFVKPFSYDQQTTQESGYSTQQPPILTSNSNTNTNINKQQRTGRSTLSRSSTASTISSDVSINIDKNQQQPIRTNSQPPMTNVVSSVTPVTGIQQQQQQQQQQPQQSVTYPTSYPLTIGTAFSSTSVIADKQEQPTPVISSARSSTSDSFSADISSDLSKQQQQQIITNPILLPPTNNNIMPSVISTNFDKQPLIQQNQHISVHSAFQSTINDSVPITAWNLNDMHRPQTQMRSVTQPPTPNIIPAFTSVFVNKQPYQSPIHPSQQPLTINNMPSSAFSPNDKQRQQTQILPLSRSTTYNFIPSPRSIATDDQSQQLQGFFFPATIHKQYYTYGYIYEFR